MLDRDYRASGNQYRSMMPGLQDDLGDARAASTGMRDTAASMFMRAANQPSPFGRLGGSGSGYAMPSGYTEARNVAWNPAKSMAVGGYGNTYDQDRINMWGQQISNGGLEGNDEANMRRAATNVIPSFFANMKNDMDRRRVVQGGYSPGYDAQTAKMARDATLRAQEASENAEGNIANMRVQGRLAGRQGMDNFFGQARNQDLDARRFGIQSMMGMGQDELDWNKFASGSETNNMMEGARGMAGLYGTSPGALNSGYGNMFDAMRGRDASNLQYLGQRYGANPQTDWFGRIAGLAGGIGGMATGFGMLGGRR